MNGNPNLGRHCDYEFRVLHTLIVVREGNARRYSPIIMLVLFDRC